MKRTLSTADQLVLDRLLSELVDRVNAAVDFWPSACLGFDGLVFDPHRFLLEQGEILRAFVVVLRAILAKAGLGDEDQVRGRLQTLATARTRLQESFTVLEKFREVPLEEVREATETLEEAHAELVRTIRELGDALGIELACWQATTPAREHNIRKVLQGLFDLFRTARADGRNPVAAERALP